MNHARATQIDQVVYGRADRAAGVQHVVEKDHDLVGDIEWNARVIDGAAGEQGIQVVAIQCDIHLADRNFSSFSFLHDFWDTLCHVRAAGSDADKDEWLKAGVLPRDFPGETFKNNLDLLGVKDALFSRLRVLHWRLEGWFPSAMGCRARYLRG